MLRSQNNKASTSLRYVPPHLRKHQTIAKSTNATKSISKKNEPPYLRNVKTQKKNEKQNAFMTFIKTNGNDVYIYCSCNSYNEIGILGGKLQKEYESKNDPLFYTAFAELVEESGHYPNGEQCKYNKKYNNGELEEYVIDTEQLDKYMYDNNIKKDDFNEYSVHHNLPLPYFGKYKLTVYYRDITDNDNLYIGPTPSEEKYGIKNNNKYWGGEQEIVWIRLADINMRTRDVIGYETKKFKLWQLPFIKYLKRKLMPSNNNNKSKVSMGGGGRKTKHRRNKNYNKTKKTKLHNSASTPNV